MSLKEMWNEWIDKVKELGKVESSRPAIAKLLKAMEEIDLTVDNANGKSVTNTSRITIYRVYSNSSRGY